jgi:hypothetical protein
VLPARAQVTDPENTRFTAGGAFIVSEPKEEFRRNVGIGYGGGGTMLYHLKKSGLLSFRLDVSGVVYGRERKRVPFSETVGGRILVDVTTTNSIVNFAVGPELALPSGWVRPYLHAGYSRLFFRTTSSVQGMRSSDEEIASTTNYSDGTGAWLYGGGVRIPLGSRDSPVVFDAGFRYHRGGEASYLREGSIQDGPGGSITITPLSSRTPFAVYAIGIQYRFPYQSSNPCPRLLC